MVDVKKESIFSEKLLEEIRKQFCYLEQDNFGRKRLFFENSGGSLRLKAAVEAKAKYEQIPDCPERYHDISLTLRKVKEDGINDIMKVMLGAKSGLLVSELTASQVMFKIVRAIIENGSGSNVVTTEIEHPSAYDSAKIYAKKTGKEFRVAKANCETGGVDIESILKLVDKDTCLLSVMSASNITGNILPIKELVKEVHKINPNIFIISDAVQHVPHAKIDVEELGIDAMTFAPYKAFGIRGCGFGYISDRVAKLFHDKLEAKPEKEWELGTFPHPNFASISAVVDYVCWIGSKFIISKDRRELYIEGITKIHLQELALLHRMMEGTKEIPGLKYLTEVEVYCDDGSIKDRDLISAIGIKGIDYTKLREEYYKRGVTVFERVNTSLYSKRIVESLGLVGLIRVSPLHCHKLEEIDLFLKITSDIIKTIKK